MNASSMPLFLTRQLPRTITGLLLAAALVTCLILGGYFLAGALALISALALFEFFQMCWPGKTKICSKAFGILAGVLMFCPVGAPASIQILLALSLVWAATVFLFDYGRGNDDARLETHAVLPLGLLYIPVILHMALGLSLKEQFLVAAAAIASDTAAFYVGCALGQNKIWPRVSPKKSWQGSIGGFAVSVAVTMAIACIPYGNGPLYGGNLPLWFGIGALLNLAAQFGDFFESAFKRTRHVKDSSGILPGHGGIMDRIDSILFTLAMYSAVVLVLGRLTA